MNDTIRDMRSLFPKNFVLNQLEIIRGSSNNHKKADKTLKLLRKHDSDFSEKHLGTNVLTVKHKKYKDVVFKIAMDDEGQRDGIVDAWYSKLLPYHVDVYYVAPKGIYSIQEKVKMPTGMDDFTDNYLEDVIKIQDILVNEYDMLLVDMSLRTIYNFGKNKDGLIKICDGSDMIELDGAKLTCPERSIKNKSSKKFALDETFKWKECGGKLEYDDEYHYLICKKCGTRHYPVDIAKRIKLGGRIAYRKLHLGEYGLPPEILSEIVQHTYDVAEDIETRNIFDDSDDYDSEYDENDGINISADQHVHINTSTLNSIIDKIDSEEDLDDEVDVEVTANEADDNQTESQYTGEAGNEEIIEDEDFEDTSDNHYTVEQIQDEDVLEGYTFYDDPDNALISTELQYGLRLTEEPVDGYKMVVSVANSKTHTAPVIAIYAEGDAEAKSADEYMELVKETFFKNVKVILVEQLNTNKEKKSSHDISKYCEIVKKED